MPWFHYPTPHPAHPVVATVQKDFSPTYVWVPNPPIPLHRLPSAYWDIESLGGGPGYFGEVLWWGGEADKQPACPLPRLSKDDTHSIMRREDVPTDSHVAYLKPGTYVRKWVILFQSLIKFQFAYTHTYPHKHMPTHTHMPTHRLGWMGITSNCPRSINLRRKAPSPAWLVEATWRSISGCHGIYHDNQKPRLSTWVISSHCCLS